MAPPSPAAVASTAGEPSPAVA
uniref:Uncharacterized protein n=1 Tax=Macrostomum lignano TaxID=282301 RepID=A0A1I8JPE9_9PLAT